MSSLVRSVEIHGQAGPRLLITAGVHGDEFEGIQAVHRLAEELSAASLRGCVTLVPIANANAFFSHDRVGEDGLDLARICPGVCDGSLTQRVAHEISGLIDQTDYYVDLHSGGRRMSVLPLSGYLLHQNGNVLETQRRMAHAFGLPLIWGAHPELEGRTLSVARDAKVPAIYAEWLGAGVCDPEGVDAYVRGCLNVMAMLNMLDRPIDTQSEKTILEDNCPGSGHIQANCPSPLSGLFVPEVKLGQSVEQGQPLGQVLEILGLRSEKILAPHSGTVVVLRTLPAVSEGDCLGMVLKT